MLDIIAAIYVGALCAIVVGTLVGLSALSARAKLTLFAAAAAWLGIIVTVAALGWMAPGALGPIPGILLLAFTVLLSLLFGGWALVPEFRNAILSLPLAALVGVQAGRLGGVFFLLFHAEGRLSAPFAPAAGGGDIMTGACALALAVVRVDNRSRLREPGLIAAANALTILDHSFQNGENPGASLPMSRPREFAIDEARDRALGMV
jgi:hypothetical protein